MTIVLAALNSQWGTADRPGNASEPSQSVKPPPKPEPIPAADQGSDGYSDPPVTTAPPSEAPTDQDSTEPASPPPVTPGSGGGGGNASPEPERPDSTSGKGSSSRSDLTPPSIVPPENVVFEATGTRSVLDLGAPTVIDLADSRLEITNDAPRGGFPIGTTLVTWTVTDSAGNSNTASQTVKVLDTKPPVITAPADILRSVKEGTKLTVVQIGTPRVRDIVDPKPTITNNAPDDGFPIGATKVKWTARDASGNIATYIQKVTIEIKVDNPGPTDSDWKGLHGVNFIDPVLSKKERKDNVAPNPAYVTKYMGFAKKYNFNIIRVPIYWEAYVGNEENFLAETELIAKEAQKHGIKVIYDNHHFFATSHWGADIRRGGIGFPSMLTGQYNPVGDGNTQTDNYGHAEVRAFWDDFFNNKVRNVPDAWSLQANYMKAVIERVDKYDNVLGYEILNEPHLWKKEHYTDLGEYHTAIVKKLRQVTDKTIIFTRETTHGSYNRDPDYEKLILPLDPDKNVMYWPHTYQPPSRDAGQLQVKQFKRYQSEWAAMGYDVKIGIGEWGTQSNQIAGLPGIDEAEGQALMDSFVSTWAKEDWPVTYWAFGCFSCGEGNKIIESDGSLTKYGKRYVKAIETYYD